jgi:hypothetical protein
MTLLNMLHQNGIIPKSQVAIRTLFREHGSRTIQLNRRRFIGNIFEPQHFDFTFQGFKFIGAQFILVSAFDMINISSLELLPQFHRFPTDFTLEFQVEMNGLIMADQSLFQAKLLRTRLTGKVLVSQMQTLMVV